MFCSRFQRLKSIPAEGMVEHSSSLCCPERRERGRGKRGREGGRREGKKGRRTCVFLLSPFYDTQLSAGGVGSSHIQEFFLVNAFWTRPHRSVPFHFRHFSVQPSRLTSPRLSFHVGKKERQVSIYVCLFLPERLREDQSGNIKVAANKRNGQKNRK